MNDATVSDRRLAGVELGGTKAIVVLADGLDIVERVAIPTTTPAETLARAVDVLAAWRFDAIGIGSFGPVRVDRSAPDFGTMLDTPKPGWRGARIVAPFAERFACPVALDTDVNVAGMAEAAVGAGRDCRTIVYLTIGTGVGGGIVVAGKPVAGRLHPEVGHLRLRRAAGDAFTGACPFHGDCVEGLISGPALAARFGRDPAKVDPADAGWEMAVQDFAELFAALMLTLSPERIIVGGSVALGQPDLMVRATVVAADRLIGYVPDYDAEALARIVVPPALGHDAGPLGTIFLAASALPG
ncbi:ROK family protein [Sphingopyxis panaciterrae]